MYLTSEAQAVKHACTRFGLRLSRITPQGVKDFFHVCDLFLGDLMLRDRKETFSLVHVLSSFIQADRAATARATSRRENPDLDSRSQQCSHTTALAPRRRTARQQTLPTCHRELLNRELLKRSYRAASSIALNLAEGRARKCKRPEKILHVCHGFATRISSCAGLKHPYRASSSTMYG